MKYSVYIIQDRNIKNQALFDNLTGDMHLGKHLVSSGLGAVNDLAGADVVDPYASKDIVGQNGIVINGPMIDSVSIKGEAGKKELFTDGINRFDFFTIRTITVKGSLFAPSLFEMKSPFGTVKFKDMSNVMAWANLTPEPLPNELENPEYSGDVVPNQKDKSFKLKPSIQNTYGKNHPKHYYRRVLVTSYSNTDTQFRAVLYDKVFVSSYEEVYDDKDGNGKFTLVMQSIAANVYDVVVAGPTYEWGFNAVASATSEISSIAQKHTKTTNKIVETIDKLGGTHYADDVKNVTGKIDSIAETSDSIRDDSTTDNIFDNIGKQGDAFTDQTKKTIEQAKEYKKAYDKLTEAQKATLDNIPDFKEMSIEDKMKYVKKLTEKK